MHMVFRLIVLHLPCEKTLFMKIGWIFKGNMPSRMSDWGHVEVRYFVIEDLLIVEKGCWWTNGQGILLAWLIMYKKSPSASIFICLHMLVLFQRWLSPLSIARNFKRLTAFYSFRECYPFKFEISIEFIWVYVEKGVHHSFSHLGNYWEASW